MGGRGTGAKRAATGWPAPAGRSRSAANTDIRRSLVMLAGGRNASEQTVQGAAPAGESEATPRPVAESDGSHPAPAAPLNTP